MVELKLRIIRAAKKRGNKLTQSELTRYVVRVKESIKQKMIRSLEKEGLIKVVQERHLSTTGTNPVLYYLTDDGIAYES